MSLPVAVQLYTLRDELEQDFYGTIKKVKEFGYDGVELAGFYGLTVQEIKKALDDVGLRAISAHAPFDQFENNLQQVIDDYKFLGCEYVAIPWMPTEALPGGDEWDVTLEKIKSIAKAVTDAGLILIYHNHDFEFVKVNGEYALDVLYNSVSPELLKAQIDTCWVKVAGLDPAEYVKKYSGRVPLVHLKDYNEEGQVPVGAGVQDIPTLLEASKTAGVACVIVELDSCESMPPIEAVRLSREYLRGQGW